MPPLRFLPLQVFSSGFAERLKVSHPACLHSFSRHKQEDDLEDTKNYLHSWPPFSSESSFTVASTDSLAVDINE